MFQGLRRSGVVGVVLSPCDLYSSTLSDIVTVCATELSGLA
jgi:hypothetical protein